MPSYANGPRAFRASTGPLAIRRRTPVSRFACVFFIAFLSTAASCSQLTQKDDDRKEMGRQLTEGYYSCVRLCTNIFCVSATDNGRPQYGNRSGF